MKNKKNCYGILSISFGIGGFLLSWVPFLGTLTSIFSIYFGVKQKKIKSTTEASTGILFGIVGLFFSIISLAIYLIFKDCC